MKNNKKAFSLIELSVVILIIGILVAGVTQSSRLIYQFKLSSARNLTTGSAVSSIKGLSFWLDATSQEGGGENIEDGDPVISWASINPQITERKLAIQNDPNRQPTYVARGINGLPSFNFDGPNGVSSANTEYLQLPNQDGDIASPSFTLFIVSQMVSGGGFVNMTYHHSNSTARTGFYVSRSSTVYTAILADGASSDVLLSDLIQSHSSARQFDPSIYHISFTATNAGVNSGNVLTFSSNENAESSANADEFSPNLTTPPIIGAALVGRGPSAVSAFNGNIGEIILFNRGLNAQERISVREYLAKKWNI
jgi:prepilin-type N-terminal cleavage/methylation domain-containing protein